MQRRTFLAASLAAAAVRADEIAATPPTHEDTFGVIRSGRPAPVIFDTDIGSDIDDTWALLYLLRCPELKTLLVAADAGSGTYRARLAAKFLTVCDRTDVPVAIGSGGDRPGNQQDWVGDYDLNDYPGEVLPDAVDAIIDAIHGSDDPVTLVCIGGVPNIAAALRKDPTIVGNSRFVGMHGSVRVGYGGSSTPVPEANVRVDPGSLRAVFAAPWQCSVTPLDTCGEIILRDALYRRVTDHDDPGTRALIENYRAWLTRVPWLDVKPDPAVLSSVLFDLVAVYMAHDESLLGMETLPIAVTDDGMTVVRDGSPEVRCATTWKDVDAFYDLIVDRLTAV